MLRGELLLWSVLLRSELLLWSVLLRGELLLWSVLLRGELLLWRVLLWGKLLVVLLRSILRRRGGGMWVVRRRIGVPDRRARRRRLRGVRVVRRRGRSGGRGLFRVLLLVVFLLLWGC